MTKRNLVARLVTVGVGLAVATILYELIVYVVLRPLTNKLVEDQLANSNAAPLAMTTYFSAANLLLGACYVLLLAFGAYSIFKYTRTKE